MNKPKFEIPDDIDLAVDFDGNVHGAEKGSVSAEDVEEGMAVYHKTPNAGGYEERTISAVEDGILGREIVLDNGTDLLSLHDFEGVLPTLAFVTGEDK